MGKRKTGENVKENPIDLAKKRKEDPRCENEGGSDGFFGCYLLTSLSPRFKGFTYIGFTVNPRRRIRQHNGEITSGAFRTKRKRPWEMVMCIYGFPTQVAALQFEWAWQHPRESLAVREAVRSLKTLGGIGNKIKLAYTMLTLPAWQGLNLTVNFFSTKYTKYAAGCPNLPEQMKVRVCSMDDLPCYSGIDWDSFGHDDDDHHNHEDGIEDEGSEEITCSQNSSASEDSNPKLHPESVSPFLIRCHDVAEVEEDDEFRLVETYDLPEMTVTANQNLTCEVEIIDLCTPISSGNNRSRLSAACSEIIIDLTESPILV